MPYIKAKSCLGLYHPTSGPLTGGPACLMSILRNANIACLCRLSPVEFKHDCDVVCCSASFIRKITLGHVDTEWELIMFSPGCCILSYKQEKMVSQVSVRPKTTPFFFWIFANFQTLKAHF